MTRIFKPGVQEAGSSHWCWIGGIGVAFRFDRGPAAGVPILPSNTSRLASPVLSQGKHWKVPTEYAFELSGEHSGFDDQTPGRCCSRRSGRSTRA